MATNIPKYYVRKSSTNYELVEFTFEREGIERVDQTPFKTTKQTGAIINIGDDVSIGYMDGVTFVPEFSGDVVSKSINEVSEYILESYGGRLNRASHFSQIYTDQAPEAIMEDVIDNQVTSLTYASTATSGITISKFIVKDETPAKVAERLIKLLNWQLRTDNDKNFYFEPEGNTTNNKALIVNTNCYVNGTWKYTPNSIINDLTLKGGNALFDTSESFTATASQTTFTVMKKIAGNIRITDNGTEVVGGIEGSTTTYDYYVDNDDKTIIFLVGRTVGHTIVITYAYEVPIKINARDEPSILANTTFSRKITDKSIVKMADARKRAKQILKTYSTLTKQAILLVGYNTDYLPGQTVTVTDSFNNIDQQLVISKVQLKYPQGQKLVTVGTPSLNMFTWQKDIDDRLRVLEQAQDNSDLIQQYKNFTEQINITEKVGRIRGRTETLGDSWIVGSSTNGIVGTNTSTQGGGQQVVGASGRTETVEFVVNYQDIFRERFNFNTYIDTTNTTATVDNTNEDCDFTSGQILQSEACFKGDGTITSATFTSDSTTNLAFQLSANNGVNWENVTSGTEHTFTNTGTTLLYKCTASGNATISNISIKKNG